MKFWYPFYFIYTIVVAVPIIIVATILAAVLTLIFSPIFPDSKSSYVPAILWGRVTCYILLIRVKVSGLENIDAKQSYIFTPNHQSLFDVLVVYGWLPSIFKWVMKKELRQIPFVGAACEAAGHIFIDRDNALAARQSLMLASDNLKNGVSTVIFPEGTRTKTGRVNKFKRGAFLMALDLQLPIVPITLRGSYERIRGYYFFPGRIEMIVHPPVDVTQFSAEESSKLVRHVQEIVKGPLASSK